MLSQLHELYPETAGARVVHERMLHHRDCPLFAPGTHAHRPGVITPLPGLLLAGDGVRIDLPVALMERAATTGWTAANQILTAVGTRRPRPVHGSHPRPLGAAALSRRPRKAFRDDEYRRQRAAPLAQRLAAAGDPAGERGPTSVRPTATPPPRSSTPRWTGRSAGRPATGTRSRRAATCAAVGRSALASPASNWSPGAISNPGCTSARAAARISAPTLPPRPCTAAP